MILFIRYLKTVLPIKKITLSTEVFVKLIVLGITFTLILDLYVIM